MQSFRLQSKQMVTSLLTGNHICTSPVQRSRHASLYYLLQVALMRLQGVTHFDVESPHLATRLVTAHPGVDALALSQSSRVLSLPRQVLVLQSQRAHVLNVTKQQQIDSLLMLQPRNNDVISTRIGKILCGHNDRVKSTLNCHRTI